MIDNLVVRIEENSMHSISPATAPEVHHHRVEVNGTELHYVSAGVHGSPVLLAHGFPESWWSFHKLIPRLADHHQVFAVDLRGFGESSPAAAGHDSATAAEDLVELIDRLDVGPVHLTGQDISGPTTFRVAATHPELVKSYTAIETGLPGFGFERLADVTHGGAWHIGVLAAPGIPEMLLAGRERAFLADYAIPTLNATPDAFTDADIDELARTYARDGGFTGAAGLYRSALTEADEIRNLAAGKLAMPVLAIGGGSADFTPATMRQVATDVTAVTVHGIGHYVAMEAPDRLAEALTSFYREVDRHS
jgi:pimeloyl-ACP methyl ester carboxylesterase